MKEKDINEAVIIDCYTKQLLRVGTIPVSVYYFMEELGLEEKIFYNYFNSFQSLEKQIWINYFETIFKAFKQDEEFHDFSSKEQQLSFLYALIENYKKNRSYIHLRFADFKYQSIRPWFLERSRLLYEDWGQELLENAHSNNEIINRPIISDKYHEVLWFQILYITKVWIGDESKDFEITDAAIEKSTELIFESMKKGPVDLLIDFLKFAYQNHAY